jgi:putative chitinase
MNVRPDQLAMLCMYARLARLTLLAPHINKAIAEADAGTPLRAAMFLAQLAHESGEFRYSEELWGPTPAQLRYEMPHPKAAELGNTQPGDGLRYKGRGWIQLTGRANYAAAGKALTLELEASPELAAHVEVAGRVAAWFWRTHDLNEPADRGDVEACTRRINGGLNGIDLRLAYYERAKLALGVG